MKKIILLLTTVFALLAANELKTVYSYKNAIYKAKKEDKLVLLMMTYKGCPVCDYMKDIVFERKPVLEYLNKHYFVVIKDIEKDRYPQRFSVIDSPTFFFIDPETKEEVLEKKVGGFRPDAFLNILKEANDDMDLNTTQAEQNNTISPCNKPIPCKEKQKIVIQ
jgi:thioredoxin-related protein